MRKMHTPAVPSSFTKAERDVYTFYIYGEPLLGIINHRCFGQTANPCLNFSKSVPFCNKGDNYVWQIYFRNRPNEFYKIPPRIRHVRHLHATLQHCANAAGRCCTKQRYWKNRILPLGTHSSVGKRPKNWQPYDKCTGRDTFRKTVFPKSLQTSSLPRPCRWLLRMAKRTRWRRENTILHPNGIGRAFCLCRAVGSLATTGRSRTCVVVLNHHLSYKRTVAANPSSNAGHPRPRSIRPVVGSGRMCSRYTESPPHALSRGGNDDLRCLATGKSAEK